MFFSFSGFFVKLNNRRRGKIPTATCVRIGRTVRPINDLSRRCRYFFADGYSAGQRLNADEVFLRALKLAPRNSLCNP
jgi:hypothetical protein